MPKPLNDLAFSKTLNDHPDLRPLAAEILWQASHAPDPESLFAFYGEQGEQVTVRMQRDNETLDPVVELLNADGEVLISAAVETDQPVALIEAFTLPESGVYTIRATRYTGDERPSDTTGVYTMELSLEDAGQ